MPFLFAHCMRQEIQVTNTFRHLQKWNFLYYICS
nr:MAG TPA: hypothetical protein [Bacteriophage sp.]